MRCLTEMNSCEKPWAVPQQDDISTALWRNIRLLDLDLRSQWRTFSRINFSVTSGLDQNKSILKLFDWLFFNLFELWDASECHAVGERQVLIDLGLI